jgi:hypothetical protein
VEKFKEIHAAFEFMIKMIVQGILLFALAVTSNPIQIEIPTSDEEAYSHFGHTSPLSEPLLLIPETAEDDDVPPTSCLSRCCSFLWGSVLALNVSPHRDSLLTEEGVSVEFHYLSDEAQETDDVEPSAICEVDDSLGERLGGSVDLKVSRIESRDKNEKARLLAWEGSRYGKKGRKEEKIEVPFVGDVFEV